MSLDADLSARLAQLESEGLLRQERTLSGRQGPTVSVDGRELVCICSNNYLGLAGSAELSAAANASADQAGTGAGASRLITGTTDAHTELEAALADYVGAEEAVLFSSGYAANLGTIASLVGPGDVIFSDSLNHASIIDGCRLSRARIVVYPHRDTETLSGLLAQERRSGARALVVSDGLFSMDGDQAPVAELRRLADTHDAALMIDEAHSLGVLGPGGRGILAEAGIAADVLVGTLGKAFGVSGAFVAGSSTLADFLRNRARTYVYSTAPTVPVIGATRAALKLVREADDRRRAVLRAADRLRGELRTIGYEVKDGSSQIVPVLFGDAASAMACSEELFQRGVWAQGIRPPTVPPGTSRIRLAPMATHTDAHLDTVIRAFSEVRS